jgi:outer membrane biosynthesis protein TonB
VAANGRGVAFAGTLVIHVAVGAFLLRFPADAGRAAPPVYRVQLVAAPRAEPETRRAPEVVERPAERPAPAVPVTPRPARPDPRSTPTPPTPTPREPSPRTTPAAEPLPDVTPSTGSDPATVEVEGLEFPYPEYLRNIVAQVYRRWERPTGNVVLKAEVFFLVHRDGTISNLRFVTRSGSFAFDLEAEGAIEAAATAGGFGPLPDGFADDVLPVSFFFDPQKVR